MKSVPVAYLIVRQTLRAAYPNLGCRSQPFSDPIAPCLDSECDLAETSDRIRLRQKPLELTNGPIFAASADDNAEKNRRTELDESPGHHMRGAGMNWGPSA